MKPILVKQEGIFIFVKYPYRKSPDLYIGYRNEPAFCAQCDSSFPLEELVGHIRSHDRRKGEAALWNYDNGQWYEVKGFSHTKPKQVSNKRGGKR